MTQRLSRESFDGIFAAVLTPLTGHEGLDHAAFDAIAHALLAEGQRGLYVTGGTGEAYGIDDDVRVAAFKLAAAAARTRGRGEQIIAHVGGVHTRRAIAMAKAAADAGCHAVSALPPYGGRYNYEELSDYYAELARATPLPAIVYYIPQTSGYEFSREQLSRWLELPNVAGIKFTSHDMFKLERLATLHPDKLIFSGPDELLSSGLGCGAIGAIGTTYNLVGPLAIKLHAAVRRGHQKAALTGQGALNAFIEAYLKAGGLRAFKFAAARKFNWQSGRSPAPAAAPTEAEVALIQSAADAALRAARELK